MSDRVLNLLVKGVDETKGMFGGLTVTLGDVMNIASGAARAIGGVFTGALDAAEKQQDAQAQLQAGLTSTGGKAGVTMDQMNALAEAQSRVTDFSKTQTEAIEKVALTFTSVNKDVFPDTIKLSEDMSQRLGLEGTQAMTLIGKAMDDPIKGLGALHRVGVSFTEQQKEQIKVLVANGDNMGAQKILLQELSTEYGGSALAAGATFSGQQKIIGHQMEEMQEKIGNALIPALGKLQGIFTQTLLPSIQSLAQWVGDHLPAGLDVLVGWFQSPAFQLFAVHMREWLGTAVEWVANVAFPGLQHAVRSVLDFLASPGFGAFAGMIQGLIGDALHWVSTVAFPRVNDAIQLALHYLASPDFAHFVRIVRDDIGIALNWIGTVAFPIVNRAINDVIAYLRSPDFAAFARTVQNDIGLALNWLGTVAFPIVNRAINDVITYFRSPDFAVFARTIQNDIGLALNWIGTVAFPIVVRAVQDAITYLRSPEFAAFARTVQADIGLALNWLGTVAFPIVNKAIQDAIAYFRSPEFATFAHTMQADIGGAINWLAHDIFPAAQRGIKVILDYFASPGWQEFANNVRTNLGAAIQWLSGQWLSVSLIAKTFADTVQNDVIPLVSRFSDYIKAQAPAIIAGLQGMVKGALDFLLGLAQSVSSIFHGNFGGLVEGLQKMAQGMGEIMRPILDSVIEGLKLTLGRALTWLWEMGKRVGTDLINGLADGVASGAAHFQDTLAWVANNAINTARHIFDSHSDSVVFKNIGKDISGGLASGVKSRENDVSSAVRGVGQVAIGAMAPAGNNSSSISFGSGAIQIYGAQGQNVDALADAVVDRIRQRVGGRF